jgi:hypothetical protein
MLVHLGNRFATTGRKWPLHCPPMNSNPLRIGHWLAAALLIGACGAEPGLEEIEDDALGAIESEITLSSLYNAGFESDWSGWTRSGSTGLSTVARSGSQAAKLESSSGQVKRKVTGLKSGTSYVLTAWIVGNARLGVRYYGRTTVSSTSSAGVYTRVKVAFKTGSSSTSAEIYAAHVDGSAARVDDFTILTAAEYQALLDAEASGCDYPGQIIDVSSWKLQLPVGDPVKEVKNPTLATYRYGSLFRANSSCSGALFRAPVNGTTTSGSSYPRSELREMTDDGSELARWSTTSGTHRMILDQAVTRLPRGKRHLGVGQIHNGSNDVLMVRVEGSRLLVKPNGGSEVVLDSSYSLGERFRVELVASGGQIKVYYNGGSTPKLTMSKSTTSAFFKAGAYTQSNCSIEDDYGERCTSDNYGEVVIYDLIIRHS